MKTVKSNVRESLMSTQEGDLRDANPETESARQPRPEVPGILATKHCKHKSYDGVQAGTTAQVAALCIYPLTSPERGIA